MLESLPYCNPIFGLFRQHFLHQVQQTLGQSLVLLILKRNITLFIVLQYLSTTTTREWRSAEHKKVQYSSQTKHIANRFKFLISVSCVSNLRSHVPRCTTSHIQVSLLVNPSSQTKICDNALQLLFISDQNILRFEIPMYEPFSMHMLQGFQEGLNDVLDPMVIDLILFGFHQIEQLPLIDKLNAQINRNFRLINLKQLQQSSMIEEPHNLHLVFNGSSTIEFGGTVLFRERLNGKFFVIFQASSQVNRSEIALPDFFYRLVYFMEIFLVQFLRQYFPPPHQILHIVAVQTEHLQLQLEGYPVWLTFPSVFVLPQNLKQKLKCEMNYAGGRTGLLQNEVFIDFVGELTGFFVNFGSELRGQDGLGEFDGFGVDVLYQFLLLHNGRFYIRLNVYGCLYFDLIFFIRRQNIYTLELQLCCYEPTICCYEATILCIAFPNSAKYPNTNDDREFWSEFRSSGRMFDTTRILCSRCDSFLSGICSRVREHRIML